MFIILRKSDASMNSGRTIYFYALVALMFIVGGIGTLFFHNQDSLFAGYELTAAAGDSGSGITYYVSTTGSDTNNGTSIDTPFKTIQKAANMVHAGDTVYIRDGVYRERVYVNNSGTSGNLIKFFAYQNEKPVISGANVVTGWVQHQGNIWKKENWTYNSQQVFVDFTGQESALQQIGYTEVNRGDIVRKIVGSGLSDMTAGSFFSDKANNTLYVWLRDGSDPNTHTVEASVQVDVFNGRSYTHIKGLAFRFSNQGATMQQWAGVAPGFNSITEDCDIGYMDYGGVATHDGGKLIDSYIHHNGNNGVASNGHNVLIARNRIQYNNTREFLTSHLGGLKLIPNFGGVIEYNDISYNKGMGLWIDTNYLIGGDGDTVTIRYNFLRSNLLTKTSGVTDGDGIFYEISKKGLIHDNIIVGNHSRGVYISGSRDTKAFNNTIMGDITFSALDVGNVGLDGGKPLIDNMVYNNIVLASNISHIMLDLFNGYKYASVAYGNKSDYNLFYGEDRPGFVRIVGNSNEPSNSTFFRLSEWRAFGGQDTNSINSDPKTSSSATGANSANDAKLQWNSPAIDAGTLIPGIDRTRDYFGNPIYGTPDIGAVEYQPPYDIRSNSPDVGANVRVYADGKFRNKLAPSGTVAKIKFSPAGGYPSNTYSQWIDLTIRNSKDFDITSSDIGIPGIIISVGDLTPNSYYAVSVDSVQGTGVTGTGYASGVAKADSSGTITWRYDGSYAKHTFTIAETTTTPVPVNETPVVVDTKATQRPPRIPRVTPQPQPVDPNAPAPVNYGDTQDILNSEAPVTPDTVLANLSKWTYVLPDSFLFTRSLEVGDTGDDVKALQYILARENSLDPSTITGTYDAATATELEKLQKRFGIVVSRIEKVSGYGVLGTRTWTKLNQAIYRGRYKLRKTTVVTTTPTATAITPTVPVGTPFTTPLRFGMTHPDVKRLQAYLNQKGFTVAKTGNGSVGRETTYFGPATRAALIKFQEFYKTEILTPVGLTKGSGYFGPSTMRKVNGGS